MTYTLFLEVTLYDFGIFKSLLVFRRNIIISLFDNKKYSNYKIFTFGDSLLTFQFLT